MKKSTCGNTAIAGWLLAKYRTAAGMTLRQSGKEARVSFSAISKAEHGERRVDVVEFVRLARVYDVPRDRAILELDRAINCAS